MAAQEWAIDGRNLNATSIDMETVVMHEIGHVLGLAHSSVAAAVMYPTVPMEKKKTLMGFRRCTGPTQITSGSSLFPPTGSFVNNKTSYYGLISEVSGLGPRSISLIYLS